MLWEGTDDEEGWRRDGGAVALRHRRRDVRRGPGSGLYYAPSILQARGSARGMSLDTGPVPCRLSVILAREAPVGVILRRGPSKLVELIKWHTDTDTFERGQWFKGRINEYCSDLSPDGSHLIYLAEKSPIDHVFDPDWFTSWTAVSRPPWLTAVAFWPGRSRSFGGGGLFLDNQTVLVGPHSADLSSPNARKPPELVVLTQPYLHIYTARLEASGWRPKPIVQTLTSSVADPLEKRKSLIWEKDDPAMMRTVEMYWNRTSKLLKHSYALIDRRNGRRIPLEGAFWADWDRKGRLVFTRDGKVCAGDFDVEGQMVPRELADFNGDRFEAREAPAWAREW